MFLRLLTVGVSAGLVCGFATAAVRRSPLLGIFVFTGSVVGTVGIFFGFVLLLTLLLKSRNPMLQIAIGANSPTANAVAPGSGEWLLLILLVPIALLGAIMGSAAYERWGTRRAS